MPVLLEKPRKEGADVVHALHGGVFTRRGRLAPPQRGKTFYRGLALVSSCSNGADPHAMERELPVAIAATETSNAADPPVSPYPALSHLPALALPQVNAAAVMPLLKWGATVLIACAIFGYSAAGRTEPGFRQRHQHRLDAQGARSYLPPRAAMGPPSRSSLSPRSPPVAWSRQQRPCRRPCHASPKMMATLGLAVARAARTSEQVARFSRARSSRSAARMAAGSRHQRQRTQRLGLRQISDAGGPADRRDFAVLGWRKPAPTSGHPKTKRAPGANPDALLDRGP